MNEKRIEDAFRLASEIYAEQGVDVETAMERAAAQPLSLHCWQGDDVLGFDGALELTGGIAATGNYPGRARSPEELRQDLDEVLSLIPGVHKLNLHASYAEKSRSDRDRDSYDIDDFTAWVDWARGHKIGMDFNPTFFSHPRMDGDFSLASDKKEVRAFWVEHGKRCREIALEFAQRLGQPCVVNYWMPDGFKDTVADSVYRRKLMSDSLDAIFSEPIDENMVPCAIESKLFGIGTESYTVVNHEFAYGYALSRHKLYCLDAGHFHPTELISAKISSVLLYLDRLLLHVSRPVRWDSDHVVTQTDELQSLMDEVFFNHLEDRVFIGMDYFDASISRIAAWVIGMRSTRKAMLAACLAPSDAMRRAEHEGDFGLRLALQEERKALPLGAIWDYFCMKNGVSPSYEWIERCRTYERAVLALRV